MKQWLRTIGIAVEPRMQLAKQFSLLFELYSMESNDNPNEGARDREGLERSLDSIILERYKKVGKTGARGVAIFEDGACSSCHNAYAQSYAVFGCGWFISTCAFCGTLLIGYEPGAQISPHNVKTPLASLPEGEELELKNKEQQPANEPDVMATRKE